MKDGSAHSLKGDAIPRWVGPFASVFPSRRGRPSGRISSLTMRYKLFISVCMGQLKSWWLPGECYMSWLGLIRFTLSWGGIASLFGRGVDTWKSSQDFVQKNEDTINATSTKNWPMKLGGPACGRQQVAMVSRQRDVLPKGTPVGQRKKGCCKAAAFSCGWDFIYILRTCGFIQNSVTLEWFRILENLRKN